MPAAKPASPSDSISVHIDYPPTVRRRWGGPDATGHPRPACDAIERLLARNAPHIEAFVRATARLAAPVVGDVPLDAPGDDPTPRWNQSWMPASDALAIVGAVGGAGGAHTPATYVEIGSGYSTRFARRTIERLGLPTRLVSIDPHPRAEIDSICDRVVRERLEDSDLGVFDALVPGDVVFFDGSHRCLQNSDVTVFFLEVIPRLAPGVLIGVHDVFWPLDYPSGFAGRWYSEQYVLGAYLLGLGDRGTVRLATHALTPALRATLLSGIPAEVLRRVPNPGGASLWFERADRETGSESDNSR